MGNRANETTVLHTERFVLRPLTVEDVTERYVGWVNDPEVTRHLEVRFTVQTIETVGDYVKSHDNVDRYLFGIFTRGGGLHIGNYSLRLERRHEKGILGVMIGDKEFWGKDVVRETRAAMLDFCFDVLEVYKVRGATLSNNYAAIFNYQSQGWIRECIRRNEFVYDGVRLDSIEFAMYRDLWQNLK